MIQSNSTQAEDGVAQPLLSSWQPRNLNRCSNSSCPLRFICIPSKAIFILLTWALVVSEFYSLIHATIKVSITDYVPMGEDYFVSAVSFPLGIVYAILAVIGIFYPLCGFLADVYCLQFKIILSCLTLTNFWFHPWLLLSSLVSGIVWMTLDIVCHL